jgi:iron-sulfur cluster assembly protein
MSNFPISLSDEAVAHAKRLMERRGNRRDYLRIGVKGGGCSGFEYVIKFDPVKRASDLELEVEGIHVVVDPKSATMLEGAKITYSSDLLTGGFVFDNPNAARSCGCGTSFTLKTAG